MRARKPEWVLVSHGRSPELNWLPDAPSAALAAVGSWTVRDLAALEPLLALRVREIARRKLSTVTLDLAGVAELDTAGAWLLERTVQRLKLAGCHAPYAGASSAMNQLLGSVNVHGQAIATATARPHPLTRLMADLGDLIGRIGADFIALTGFLGLVIVALGSTLLRPWRFRFVAFVHHLDHAGLRALPIVSLVCLLIGAVVMQQGAVQLRPFGAELFSVNMLAILALREVGVLLTAVMVAGRSGSAYTAEIGAMKMREEIDAMRTLGLDPMETLVLPRLLALLVALPVLTFVGSMMCLVGGGIAASISLGLDWPTYLERLREAVTLKHLFVGMIKTPFAALIIALIGCVEGLKVAGSAESLGQRVTSAVVKAIFLVIVVDGLFAIALAGLGF
jgi:phospholipid/cholesterol/gamma-HCH transport system permease protein